MKIEIIRRVERLEQATGNSAAVCLHLPPMALEVLPDGHYLPLCEPDGYPCPCGKPARVWGVFYPDGIITRPLAELPGCDAHTQVYLGLDWAEL